MREGIPSLSAGESGPSPHGLHRLAELRPLPATIHGTARCGLAFLHIDRSALADTGCWANFNARGASHRMHPHPNNFLAGGYYESVPSGADTITPTIHARRPGSSVRP